MFHGMGQQAVRRLAFQFGFRNGKRKLGMEFLKSEKCKLDFQTDTLQIGREVIKLTTFVGQHWARRIQEGEEITLPTESTNIEPAKMLIGNTDGESGCLNIKRSPRRSFSPRCL